MPEITLSEEQSKVVAGACQPVQIRDSKGNLIGVLPPAWTEEDIAEAKRRLASDEPRYTTAQVLEYLKTLKKQ